MLLFEGRERSRDELLAYLVCRDEEDAFIPFSLNRIPAEPAHSVAATREESACGITGHNAQCPPLLVSAVVVCGSRRMYF